MCLAALGLGLEAMDEGADGGPDEAGVGGGVGGLGTRRMIDRAVMLLPQPDSPTMPSVSPGRSSNDTPSTARTTPARVKKRV